MALSRRPEALKTMNDFLDMRDAYPDTEFRSVTMKMLRDVRKYVGILEAENATLRCVNAEKDLTAGKASTELVEIIKHAITIIASKETN